MHPWVHCRTLCVCPTHRMNHTWDHGLDTWVTGVGGHGRSPGASLSVKEHVVTTSPACSLDTLDMPGQSCVKRQVLSSDGVMEAEPGWAGLFCLDPPTFLLEVRTGALCARHKTVRPPRRPAHGEEGSSPCRAHGRLASSLLVSNRRSSFENDLLSTYCVPSTVPGAGFSTRVWGNAHGLAHPPFRSNPTGRKVNVVTARRQAWSPGALPCNQT